MALGNRAQLVTSQTWDDSGKIAKKKRHAAGTSVCHHRRAIAGKAEKYAVGLSLSEGVTIRTMLAMLVTSLKQCQDQGIRCFRWIGLAKSWMKQVEQGGTCRPSQLM